MKARPRSGSTHQAPSWCASGCKSLVRVQPLRDDRVRFDRDRQPYLQPRSERWMRDAGIELESRGLTGGEVQVRQQAFGLVDRQHPGSRLQVDELRELLRVPIGGGS